jgi:hypothetical protein
MRLCVVIFLFISLPSKASPFPPAPECKAQIKILRNLGMKSVLHKDLQEKINAGSHDDLVNLCKGSKPMHTYLVKILKLLDPIAGCPQKGTELEVTAWDEGTPKKMKVGNVFTATTNYQGDECFATSVIKAP